MSLSSAVQQRLMTKYGPWALVTGASSGIGKELASLLAESGFNLVLTARREKRLEEIAAQFEADHAIKTRIVTADVSKPADIDKVIEVTNQLEIGLLIAAAGFGTSGDFVEADLPQELNMIQVNCEGLLIFTYHFAKVFTKQGRGGIILLSSMVGFQGVPYAANYAATKAYVQSLGEALSVELRPNGVDVLAAAPGPVASGFADRANLQMDMTLSPSDVAAPILKALGRKSTVLPGFLTKFLVTSLRTVPRWGKVRIMKLVMGGMTKHQRA